VSRANTNSHNRSSISALVVAFILVAAAIFVYMHRQYVIDQLAVWQYKPSAEIADIVKKGSLSDKGTFYFYASRPSLEDRTVFNDRCVNQEVQAAILGCYTNNDIYIYNVQNDKLEGIKTVTGAHEMLHAAYSRLSDAEKSDVDRLIEAEYKKLKNNQALSQRIAFYAKTEPGQRNNELHSLIATETQTISPKLEKYYKQYFTDRQKVVALHSQYESEFTSLQDKADTLTNELKAIASSVEMNSKQYNNDVQQLNGDINSFNSRANGGDFSSQAAFAAERDQLTARADQLDQTRRDVNQSIARYDRLQTELESIATQSDALNRSINSKLAPAPSV